MSADGDILQQGVLVGFEQFQTLFHAFGRHVVYVYRTDSCPPADVCFLFSAFEAHADGKAGAGCFFACSGGDLFLLQIIAMLFGVFDHRLIVAEKADDCFQGNFYRAGVRITFKKTD